MKLMQKGNRQLRIADERVEDLLSAGYQEIDAKTGKVLTKKATDDVKALKAENTALKKANRELTDKVAALTAAGQ